MRLSFKLLVVSLSLVLLPALALAAGPFTGIDGISSTVMQEGQSSFSGLGIRARMHSDRLVEGVVLMPTIEWWRSSTNVQPFGIESSRKDATLGMDVRYDFKREGFTPYVGAGFGFHFLATRVKAPSLGLPDASNSVLKGGLAALAGVSFGLAPRLDNFIELKYHHIPDYRQLKLNWGLGYNF